MESILFIDGRNFIGKIEAVLNLHNKKGADLSIYNFLGLFNKVLSDSDIKIDKKIFYISKLIRHPETKEKSEELIQKQRSLKSNLEKHNFEVIFAGRVRANMEKCQKGHETLVFREKGVDVKMAVDMVSFACDGKLKTAIIASSDSDLQPAIIELEKRKIERIYLGFGTAPNKGLTFTTNRTILIRDAEVLEFLGNTLM